MLQVPSTRGSLYKRAAAIGIGVGRFAAGYLVGRQKSNTVCKPLRATGITVFGFLPAYHGLSFNSVLIFQAA